MCMSRVVKMEWYLIGDFLLIKSTQTYYVPYEKGSKSSEQVHPAGHFNYLSTANEASALLVENNCFTRDFQR